MSRVIVDRALVTAARELGRSEESFVIATVVGVAGSAYRRLGARMLIARDRWVAGSVSGGCLEGDLARNAWRRTEAGPCIVTYDSAATDLDTEDPLQEGLGLDCNGIVDLLLERATASSAPIAVFEQSLRDQRRFALATVIESSCADLPVATHVSFDAGGNLVGNADPELAPVLWPYAQHVIATGTPTSTTITVRGEPVRILIEAVIPPPRVFVLGTGHDAVPVVRLARELGWEVTVCATSARPTVRERFATADELLLGEIADVVARVDASDRGVVLVMNHDYDRDRACLGAVLASHACYVGVLGPRHRAARMLAELGARAMDPRLHAPVGLALGAETPTEIALAIVAEIQAALTATPAPSLRTREGAIHGPQRSAGPGAPAAIASRVDA